MPSKKASRWSGRTSMRMTMKIMGASGRSLRPPRTTGAPVPADPFS
jgi:hypothetical protein